MSALKPYEQEVLDRITSGPNEFGWFPWRRNDRGEAQLRADLQMDGYVRALVMTITARGTVTSEFTIQGTTQRDGWRFDCKKHGGRCGCPNTCIREASS